MHTNDLRGKGQGLGLAAERPGRDGAVPSETSPSQGGVGWAGLEMPDKYGMDRTATAMGAVGQG